MGIAKQEMLKVVLTRWQSTLTQKRPSTMGLVNLRRLQVVIALTSMEMGK